MISIPYAPTNATGKEGYIYVFHAEGTNRYKIGRSKNPIQRIQDIQKQSPYKLVIKKSFYTPDCFADEKYLHKDLAEYRVFQEWFEIPYSSHEFRFLLNCKSITVASIQTYYFEELHNLGMDTNASINNGTQESSLHFAFWDFSYLTLDHNENKNLYKYKLCMNFLLEYIKTNLPLVDSNYLHLYVFNFLCKVDLDKVFA